MDSPSFTLSRRQFIRLTGSGLVVALVFRDLRLFAGESPGGSPVLPPGEVGAWIQIGEDGAVSVYTGKVEFGQNIRTSLSQIVSEELKVPLSSITMVMGDTDLVPYDAGTFGSRTTPQMGTQLRKAAATAREALIGMAAKKWDTTTDGLFADKGMIVNPANNQKLAYGMLTKGQQIVHTISDDVAVIAAKDWKVAGKTVRKVDGQRYITGRHKYVSDMQVPDMQYGKVLRAPSYNAKLVSADVSKAENIPGVAVVRDGDFIGVVAPDVVTATKALQLIDVHWEEATGQPSTANIFDYLVKNAGQDGGGTGESGGGSRRGGREAGGEKQQGDVEAGIAQGDFQHAQTYHVNYIAHVPLEPRAALAEWIDGKLTVWTGTQRPFGVHEELVDTFHLPKEKVRVIVPDTGSGYGGKHSGEAAIEAARLAKAVNRPVKLVWTREEEFTWAYFRPAGVIEVTAGVKKDGTIAGWKFINYNSGNAGMATQYRTVNKQEVHIPSRTPLRQGSYRALAATGNVFARECHMTDLARLIKMDPLEFRLKNLDDERFKDVLQAASKAFGWDGPKVSGHGYGIAGGFEKGGHIATCAEVAVNPDKEVRIIRVTQAFECGAIVNPHHLENQITGAIIQGLGGALFEKIEFENGKILNPGLSAYRVPRFSDVPKIEVVLINRKDLPSAGAGEAGIVGIAPAIRNAILDATGTGLTTLPMIPNGTIR
ncbi:MAG TPA: molybdopterin cofactor-binding domain-containing protein [Puia sp.]|nr:molybdopterin cofactor-binding domain-containing protein [Puia sp.]